MSKVSVIVPVYNVEEYLRECLDSLVNQTFEDMEIICINDGSTDSSEDIIKEYANVDSRIKIINQENKGLSGARNTGLEAASGDYVYFLDSDDYIKDSAIEELYNLASEKDLDIVLFQLTNFNDETDESYPSKDKYYEIPFLDEHVGDKVFSYRDLPAEYSFRIPMAIPLKFFRRDLISDLRFPEGLLFEDNPFFMEAFFRADKVYFYHEKLYLRRIRDESITTKPSADYMSILEISELLIDISKKYGVYEDYKEGLYYKTLNYIFLRFTQVDEKYKPEFFEKIKQYCLDKKEEYSNDEKFNNIPERLQKIFYSAIESDTYKEYELSMNLFDTQFDLDRTIRLSNNKITIREEKIDKLNNRIDRDKTKIRELNGNIKELKQKNKTLRQENKKLSIDVKNLNIRNDALNKANNEILNSTSWKVTKPIRVVGDAFKGNK